MPLGAGDGRSHRLHHRHLGVDLGARLGDDHRCGMAAQHGGQVGRGGHSGGAGGAQATPGILIFQKQVTLFTKSGDTLELE